MRKRFNNDNTDRELADVLPYGIILVDAESQLLWWNRAAERMFGFYSEGRSIGSLVDILNDPEFTKLFQSKEEYRCIEMSSPHRSKKQLSLQLRAYGEGTWLVMSEDITEFHQLRAMKQDFVANVSHELRTPLTVFCGYLELLLDQPEENPAVLKEMLMQMFMQGKRMQNLITELMWLSRLETLPKDKMDEAVIDIPMLIQYIYTEALQLCDTKNKALHFQLEVNQTLHMLGNQDELRSAFANIVSNAVRYTPNAGAVTIRWFEDVAGLKFQVEDTGIGIPPQDIAKITQRFYRTDEARSFEQSGTGLGLAIVKHILIRQQGSLDIQSQLGVGSMLTCTFPLTKAVRIPPQTFPVSSELLRPV